VRQAWEAALALLGPYAACEPEDEEDDEEDEDDEEFDGYEDEDDYDEDEEGEDGDDDGDGEVDEEDEFDDDADHEAVAVVPCALHLLAHLSGLVLHTPSQWATTLTALATLPTHFFRGDACRASLYTLLARAVGAQVSGGLEVMPVRHAARMLLTSAPPDAGTCTRWVQLLVQMVRVGAPTRKLHAGDADWLLKHAESAVTWFPSDEDLATAVASLVTLCIAHAPGSEQWRQVLTIARCWFGTFPRRVDLLAVAVEGMERVMRGTGLGAVCVAAAAPLVPLVAAALRTHVHDKRFVGLALTLLSFMASRWPEHGPFPALAETWLVWDAHAAVTAVVAQAVEVVRCAGAWGVNAPQLEAEGVPRLLAALDAHGRKSVAILCSVLSTCTQQGCKGSSGWAPSNLGAFVAGVGAALAHHSASKRTVVSAVPFAHAVVSRNPLLHREVASCLLPTLVQCAWEPGTEASERDFVTVVGAVEAEFEGDFGPVLAKCEAIVQRRRVTQGKLVEPELWVARLASLQSSQVGCLPLLFCSSVLAHTFHTNEWFVRVCVCAAAGVSTLYTRQSRCCVTLLVCAPRAFGGRLLASVGAHCGRRGSLQSPLGVAAALVDRRIGSCRS
jgi:hypothetical protein